MNDQQWQKFCDNLAGLEELDPFMVNGIKFHNLQPADKIVDQKDEQGNIVGTWTNREQWEAQRKDVENTMVQKMLL